jgi:hypothetical protein
MQFYDRAVYRYLRRTGDLLNRRAVVPSCRRKVNVPEIIAV